MDVDPLVWTNQRFIKWAKSIDLMEYAENLVDSGVHGALVILEPSFTADTMATALGIPASKNIIRRHLTTELENLIQPARLSLEAEAFVNTRKSDKRSTGSSGYASLGRNFSRSHSRGTLERVDKERSSMKNFWTWSIRLKPRRHSSTSNSFQCTPTPSTKSLESRSHVRSPRNIPILTVTPV
ncbi:kazrin-like [Limulus polyphemus]|uniref:Kazrin-like n=1 Tax=Limulus polyphemus TaxID=6850 RepID=A0ABM1TIW3_LIMPO|nr:kazrin-like [Limulus polyphemus]